MLLFNREVGWTLFLHDKHEFYEKGEENEAMRAFLGFIVESFSHEFYFVLRKLCDLRSDEIGGRSIHINKGSIFVIFSYI